MPLNSRGRDVRDEPVTKRQLPGLVESAMTEATQKFASSVLSEAEAPRLARYMKENRITDIERGVTAYIRDKRAGKVEFDPDEVTAEDVQTLFKYAAREKIDLSKPGVYEAQLSRYRSDKKAGKIERYHKT